MLRTRLLWLYPPAWRARYGEEFLATMGAERLRLSQIADIVAGAIDAWLSADVRRMTAGSRLVSNGAGPMTMKMFAKSNGPSRLTPREGAIGAALLLGLCVVFRLLSHAALRDGRPAAEHVITSLSFPVALTLSMPFWLMKRTPWKAQAIVIGGTLAVLLGLTFFL